MDIQRIDDFRWRIAKHGAMRVDGIVYASRKLIDAIRGDESLAQVANVACLPGIVGASLAMPDIHWGYGFPIGGVAAFDCENGVVSPGGVGYDINCGVRLLRTEVEAKDVAGRIGDIVSHLFREIPSGVGAHNRGFSLDGAELRALLAEGARWAVNRGFGCASDLGFIEAGGCIAGADPEAVSDRALERGCDQLGTLGSGNHFVELQSVDEIYDAEAASTLGLFPGQLVAMIHTGSRGLGHQVCEDYIELMLAAARKYGIALPDKQLCCAPVGSPEGKRYFSAMAAAANFAFANRQTIAHRVELALEGALHISPRDLGLSLVYDVCHNIAKFEEHMVGGRSRRLCVHRKGATRAYPPRHPELPAAYREIGQPVLIPGDMGRYSYVLVGTARAMEECFGSTCHGAGRVMSRQAAKRACRGRDIAAAAGNFGPEGVVRASHALEPDFNATLRAFGINRTVICDELVLPKPPPGAQLIRAPQ